MDARKQHSTTPVQEPVYIQSTKPAYAPVLLQPDGRGRPAPKARTAKKAPQRRAAPRRKPPPRRANTRQYESTHSLHQTWDGRPVVPPKKPARPPAAPQKKAPAREIKTVKPFLLFLIMFVACLFAARS